MNGEENKPRERSPGRRALLKALTAVPVAAVVPVLPAKGGENHGLPAHAPDSSAAVPAANKRKVLDDHEWKTIRVLSDMIIPADERSGSATEAGVPEFIDDWLDLKGGALLAEIRGGLTWLDIECNRLFKHDFTDCSETQQKQPLDRIAYPVRAAPQDANAVAFFNHLRDLVVSGG